MKVLLAALFVSFSTLINAQESELPWSVEFNAATYSPYTDGYNQYYTLQYELKLARRIFAYKKINFTGALGYAHSFGLHEFISLQAQTKYILGEKQNGLKLDISLPILFNRFYSNHQTLGRILTDIGLGYQWNIKRHLFVYPMVGTMFLRDKSSSFPYDAPKVKTVVRPSFRLGVGYRFGRGNRKSHQESKNTNL